MKSVVLLSGGLDSAALLVHQKSTAVLAISFDYGMKQNEPERAARRLLLDLIAPKLEHCMVNLEDAFGWMDARHPLVSGTPATGLMSGLASSSSVPFRNGIFLSIGAGIAEDVGANFVAYGVTARSGVIYPDCSEVFVRNMDRAMRAGTKTGVEVLTPFLQLPKAAVAQWLRMNEPDYSAIFSASYSCYAGGFTHCGDCGACRGRKHALGKWDPTEYAK